MSTLKFTWNISGHILSNTIEYKSRIGLTIKFKIRVEQRKQNFEVRLSMGQRIL